MEDINENLSSAQQSIPENGFPNSKNTLVWEDVISAKFICRLCKKTFYNASALQNHRNTQHDAEGTGSEGDLSSNPPTSRYHDQNLDGVCGFKFIPRKASGDRDPTTVHDGLTTRVYSEDTTYLLVKVEGDDSDIDAMKRSRLNGVVKRAQMKPKQPVDLRGPFTCTFPSTLHPDLQCRQIFYNCCTYSLHYREEHTKRRKASLRCQVCEKRLDRDFYPSVTLPVPLQPQNNFTFTCRNCGQTFLEGSELDEHNRVVHAKMKPHQCSICAKRFTQLGGLQQHMRMHTGIRPFGCSYCPKAFTQKAGLDQHLRTHTKIKPFKCVICSKCFSQSVHLRQHMRTHTNIQPFECSVCGRRFKQSSHLNFHMRSHVGDGTLGMDSYAEVVQANDQIEFLNFANLQPVQDGEIMYYAAELTAGPSGHQNSYADQSQVVLPNGVLSL